MRQGRSGDVIQGQRLPAVDDPAGQRHGQGQGSQQRPGRYGHGAQSVGDEPDRSRATQPPLYRTDVEGKRAVSARSIPAPHGVWRGGTQPERSP
jgi:hypothetical protein